MSKGRLGALVALLLAVAGCAGGQPVQPRTGAESASPPAVSSGTTAELLQRRRAAGIADCPTATSAPARGDGLPDVTLDCLGADSRVRLAGLRGKPMLINIWAQWCGPCRAESAYLREVAAEAGDRVQVLGIDFSDPHPELALDFASQAGWRYPQLVDPNKLIAPELKVLGPPQTAFVDADGRVAYLHAGPFTSTAQLKQLLAEHLRVQL